MLTVFNEGDILYYEKIINATDIAAFESGVVHRVYATFALARDAEWSGRQFVLQMKESDEEGIGTYISVEHVSPAFVNETVIFKAIYLKTNGNEITTDFEAFVGDRLIAKGTQKQKILKKQKIDRLFESINK